MIRVLHVVGQKLKLEASYVRKLCFPEGNPVLDVEDLKHGGHYVALLPHESFKKPSSKIPNNYMRTYETLAQNASGNASSSAIAEAEDNDENSGVDMKKQSHEDVTAMKEASTSTTEDKATATTLSLYNNEELEDSAVQIGSPKEERKDDSDHDIPNQNVLSPTVKMPPAQGDPPFTKENNDSSNNEHEAARSPSPERNLSPQQESFDEKQVNNDTSAEAAIEMASPPTKEMEEDEDPSEIAYATPLQDAKHLHDLEEHLQASSENGNHRLKTSPDRANRTEEGDNVSLASLNSFYEHEQQLLRSEAEAIRVSGKRTATGSRQSLKRDSQETPKEQWNSTENTERKAHTADASFENAVFETEIKDAAREVSVVQPQSAPSYEIQFIDVQNSGSNVTPRPAARRRSSGSIVVGTLGQGQELRATPNDSPLTQRSSRVSDANASVNSTPSAIRRDSLGDNGSRRERRSSIHSLASFSQTQAAPEPSGRVTSLSRQSSLDESHSRNSEKRVSKASRTSPQDHTVGSVSEKSALKNSSGCVSYSSRKGSDSGKGATQPKGSRHGADKKVAGAKAKRPAEEESNNRGWSRSSSVDSLKSNKDSGYSPASERSKDSSEAPHRPKDAKDTHRAQAAASSSKHSQDELGSFYYASSPPHSPIRTYTYLLQEKPAAPSYEHRSFDSGATSQALYTSAPLRYSSASKNQWKPDTYPILEEEDVFYAKSSRGRKLDGYREVDLDEDNGGVFRARQHISDSGGAIEIQDSMDTKVDIPIDDMEALEVEEEYLPPEHTRIERSASGGPGHRVVTFLPSAGSGRSSCATSSDRRNRTRLLTRDDVQRMII